MAILEYVGCPQHEIGCWGPVEQWFFFGIPLRTYPYIILVSLLLALVVLSGLHFLDKSTKLSITNRAKWFASVIVFFGVLILLITFVAHMQANTMY